MRLKRKLIKLFRPKWPLPEYDPEIQPHFLFVVTPPYSGSTALTRLLNTGQRTTLLHRRGEGQWLIPGLSQKDRWDPEKKVNYESVRAVWLHEYQRLRRADNRAEVVIEKSPPNMVRLEELSSLFRYRSFLANNRNPYANCASMLYRHYDAQAIGMKERMRILRR